MSEPTVQAPRRPFSLSIYLVIVFALSWPFQIASASGERALLLRYAMHCAAMCMVGFAAFVAAGPHVFGDGVPRWRWGRPRHYLAGLALAVLVWIVPAAVGLARGQVALPEAVSAAQLKWLGSGLALTLMGALGAELGWRGYMLPRVARDVGPRAAVLFAGVIWWAWHIPLLIDGALRAAAQVALVLDRPVVPLAVQAIFETLLLQFMLLVLLGIVLGWLWSWSKSLPAVAVCFVLYDWTREAVNALVGMPRWGTLWATSVLLVLGAVLLWKGRWQGLLEDAEACPDRNGGGETDGTHRERDETGAG